MQIPRKPVTGENIKKYIFDTFSSIIDYLHASKIRPGNGIEVRETPCGTVISIIPRGYVAQGGGGGIAYDAGTGITITGGTPGVPEKINANIVGGSDISVTGGTNGNPLVISYIGGGGGGGGVPFPDYSLLTDSSDVPADVPGIGTTYLLPVRAGVAIKYATDGTNVFAKYAPGIGTTGGSAQLLTKDVSYTPGANGWVRIRVFDNGVDNGKCLRFFSGGVDWSGALPLYKYGTFDNGGGGGGETDAVFISEEPSDATGQIAAQTNKRYYIAVFGDLYHDEDYGYVCQYYLTYDYSTSPPTITRHKTDYTDLSDYGNGYSLELVLPAPSEDRFIDLCLFAFTTILISSSKPIYNYQGSPILQPYPIENRNVKLVYIANDNGGRWYIYNN